MNIRIVLYMLGMLLLFLAFSFLLPVFVSLFYEREIIYPFLSAALIAAVAGGAFVATCRCKDELKTRDGFALVTLSWIAFALIGALPFYFSGYIPSYTDAFFETMSGFTTTGASILQDIERLPHGLLFWRSFTHWIGGMGIILLSLAILPLLGVGGMQLYKAEVPGPEHDRLSPRLKDTAKILWEVYLLISIIEAGLLYLAGMNLFDAICHTFGTMATGGFSTKNASIGHYNSALIDYIIIFFMIIAGINFSLHYNVFRARFMGYLKDAEARFFLILIAIGTSIIAVDIYFFHDYRIGETIRKSAFQAVSIITTTGYCTDDYLKWSTSSQIILFLFMFLGGCAGSTGGGMKIIRALVLLKFGLNELKRLIHPNAVLPIRIGKRSIPREIVTHIAGFFLIYLLLFVIGIIFMSMMGLDFNTSFGAVAATIGNIGPGLGAVGPTGNYASIPVMGKWLLSFLMLVGRLEIYTVVILLTPVFWKK
jgi:trk system potassium uptake protein TrkH